MKLSKLLSNTILSLITLSLTVFTGCEPRGETKTLDQVFEIAKDHYDSLVSSNATEEIKAKMANLSGSFENMVGQENSEAIKTEAGRVADQLSDLAGDMGYTQRPSVGEIINQFRSLSTESLPSKSEVKLLVARTMNILSSELESVNFKLAERERAQ